MGAVLQARPVIVTEYAERGALNMMLDVHGRDEKKFEKKNTWKLHARIAKEAAAGLNHAHQCGYTHGDIKSPNILITRAFGAKIADFGMSAFWRQDHGQPVEEPQASGLSLMWAAPELFSRCQTNFKTDVYAFGIVLWEIAACIAPFGDNVPTGAIPQLVCSGVRPDMRVIHANKRRSAHIPAHFTELIMACWNKDAKQRPEMAVVYKTLQYICQADDEHLSALYGPAGGEPVDGAGNPLWMPSSTTSSSGLPTKSTSSSGSGNKSSHSQSGQSDPDDLVSAARLSRRSKSSAENHYDTDSDDEDHTDSLSQVSSGNLSQTSDSLAVHGGLEPPLETVGGGGRGDSHDSTSSSERGTTISTDRSTSGEDPMKKEGSNTSSTLSAAGAGYSTPPKSPMLAGLARGDSPAIARATRRKKMSKDAAGSKKKGWECPLCLSSNPHEAGECTSCGCINDTHTGRTPAQIRSMTWPMALPSIPEGADNAARGLHPVAAIGNQNVQHLELEE